MPNHQDLIRKYYDCYANNDRATLQKLLVDSFEFVSSYAEYNERDTMLDEIWPHVEQNTNMVSDLEFFSDGVKVIAKYKLIGDRGIACICECFQFEGDKISSIEVFMGKSTKEESPQSHAD